MSNRDNDAQSDILVTAFKKFFPDIKFVTLESLDNDEPPEEEPEEELEEEPEVEE